MYIYDVGIIPNMETTRKAPKQITLRSRWIGLWKDMGAQGDPVPVFNALSEAYSSGRAYHNLTHVEECLKHVDTVEGELSDPKAVKFALWFHDAIYDTHRQDNEERSAEWAVTVAMGAGMGKEFADKVKGLILNTKHFKDTDHDAQYLADIDLAILGQPTDVFNRYNQGIADEFYWVDQKPYNKARADVLSKFKVRKRLFKTDAFHDLYEARAKENMGRVIQELDAKKEDTIAVYAGSFDPPTIGHEWVINKGARIFTKLVIAIASNTAKKPTFTVEERRVMLESIVGNRPNVTVVDLGNRYTADYAKLIGAGYLLRGVRDPTDAMEERKIVDVTKTYIEEEEDGLVNLSLTPPMKLAMVSSSLVKGLIGPEGWRRVVRKLVPPGTYDKLLRRYETSG
jgi:pantetheine-phosphate adenylyltransferase